MASFEKKARAAGAVGIGGTGVIFVMFCVEARLTPR